MDPTDETEDLIRNAIETIGLVDDKSSEFVNCKSMAKQMDTNESIVLQNGDHSMDSIKEVKQNCISNGKAYKNDEEMVEHLYECSHNGVDTNVKISDKSMNNCQNVSENVISEEIALIEVISEEQVIIDEESDSHVIKTDLTVEENHKSVCNEDVKTEAANSEEIENVCNRFESSVDFEAENSSLSESSSQHSQQSSASLPIPVVSASAISATSAANTVSSKTSAVASQNSQLSEGTNLSSNSGLNKKKFGKFRILSAEPNAVNEDINDLSFGPSDDNCIDSKFDDKSADSGSGQQDSHDNSEHSDSTNPNSTPIKSDKQNKRRGRPAGSTKKERNFVQMTSQTSIEDEDLSRRRSSRLKTLEARKEQEKAVTSRSVDETSCDSTVVHTSDANDSQHSVNESSNPVKQKKKKSKKDKNKNKDKNRDKDNDSKKRKRKKRLFKNDENNCFSEQKPEKCKTSDNYKSECFAAPLPPTHYSTIKSNSLSNLPSNKCTTDSDDTSPKPEKVKSRWRRNSELESGHGFCVDNSKHNAQIVPIVIPRETEPPPHFDSIDDNIYLFERRKSKSKKETRRMVCDCILTKEERLRGLIGCGEDCLNRMLMIECGSRCSLGDHCANKRFQKKQSAKVEPFRTSKKGWGLRTLETLQPNTFIMEYIGEVIDPLDFHHRTLKYSREKREHHYFMALKSDEIIDATVKGNITRFVNHSCDPNSETQKWTVNGELRIGFFTQRLVQAGEEITFDYQFQRYGKEAQKCFCESMNCRGYIGATESANILTDGSKITETNKLEVDETQDEEDILEDLALEEEIAKLSESGGLRNRQQVLMLARLMVRAEDVASRIKLINIIKGTVEIAYLRLLLDYHGLQLIWSWMVEVDDSELKAQILELLEILPIPNKTMLTDSKVYSVVERWSQQTDGELKTINKIESSDGIKVKTTSEVKQSEGVLNDNSQSSNDIHIDSKPTEQQVEPVIESVVEPVDESMVEPMDESVVEPMDQSVVEPMDHSVVESVVQSIDQSVVEPVLQPMDQSVSKPVVEPVVESKLEPMIEPMAETEDEPMVEPIAEPIAEPMVEPKVEPNIETSDNICSMTDIEEIKQTKDVIKREIEIEDDLKDENKESVETWNKSSPRISIIIKPRSLTNGAKTESPPIPPTITPTIKSKPSIASLAQRLLLNWKELKEVFRIPRLERQKRHEDEKEADRKTMEVEERRAKGLPMAFDKRGIDDRDYTIAGILGIKRKGVKRGNDSKENSTKKGPNSSQQILSSNWNKVSKEEHRKMFEMEVAQKDYHEALKRYHQELAYYNAVYGHQIQAQQQQLYSQETAVRDQYTYGNSYEHYYQNNSFSQTSVNAYSVPNQEGVDCMTTETQPIEGYGEDVQNIDDDMVFRTETTPALIPLANFDCETTKTQSSLEIDCLPSDRIIYSDSAPTDNPCDQTSIFDAIHPPPGVYYMTPEGNNYFTPLPIDSNQKSVNLVFDDKVIVPFEPNWTKTMTSIELPLNWKHSCDKNENIYYYNKIKRKSQWIPPEEEKVIVVSPIVESVQDFNDHKLSDNEDSTSIPDIPQSISPKPVEEPIIDELIDSIAPDSITVEPEEIINSTNSPTNLLKSILALEADPRKRRHLLNSVLPSTTTAAADTSSSSNRRKFCSTRQVQEQFRNKISEYVVHCLNPYRKADCKKGRILNNNDFKFLARKITHTIMGKEIKQCKSLESLSCNDAVKHKTKDYVKRYMGRFGPFYKPDHIDKTVSPKDIVANDSND